MSQQSHDLPEKALSLSEQERADLPCSLIDRLDPSVDSGAADAWNEEIARRIADLDSEKAKAVPWEEVRRISSRRVHDK